MLIFQDYFVLVPKEYYEPTILKEDVYVPCLASQTLPLCGHYNYPSVDGYPKVMSAEAKIPGRVEDPYGVQDQNLLTELETPKLATIASYQPRVYLLH